MPKPAGRAKESGQLGARGRRFIARQERAPCLRSSISKCGRTHWHTSKRIVSPRSVALAGGVPNTSSLDFLKIHLGESLADSCRSPESISVSVDRKRSCGSDLSAVILGVLVEE